MPLSYTEYTATASQTVFTFSVPVLSSSHIRVIIDDVETESFTVSGTTVTLGTPLTGGETVRILRDTDLTNPWVVFYDASTLTSDNLNNAFLQSLYALQEIQDTYDEVSAILPGAFP